MKAGELLGLAVFVAACFFVRVSSAGDSNKDILSKTVKVCAVYSEGMKCGTGLTVGRSRILTDYHVLSPVGMEIPRVMVLESDDNRFYQVNVIDINSISDLATLQYVSRVPVEMTEDYKVGDTVDVIGNPGGQDFEYTRTVITGISIQPLSDGSAVNMVQLDSKSRIRPGYSGGGVFINGKLIGTVESCDVNGRSCYAIPSRVLKSYLQRER